MSEYTHHQFNLFPAQKPVKKVPISAEAIQKAKAFMAKGDQVGALKIMRSIREKLENFERSL